MEQQIQDLVASIRKEGIEEAKRQSAEILEKARAEADEIVRKAKEQSDALISEAKAACALEEESAKAKIVQASRDVSLSLKKSIEALFARILTDEVSKAMDQGLLSDLVAEAVRADLKGTSIEVPEGKKAEVVAALRGEAADALKKKDNVKETRGVHSGLRLTSDDGSGYVDLSAEECALLIKPYLSDKLRELIYG